MTELQREGQKKEGGGKGEKETERETDGWREETENLPSADSSCIARTGPGKS